MFLHIASKTLATRSQLRFVLAGYQASGRPLPRRSLS
jgi:hypothetical protein